MSDKLQLSYPTWNPMFRYSGHLQEEVNGYANPASTRLPEGQQPEVKNCRFPAAYGEKAYDWPKISVSHPATELSSEWELLRGSLQRQWRQAWAVRLPLMKQRMLYDEIYTTSVE